MSLNPPHPHTHVTSLVTTVGVVRPTVPVFAGRAVSLFLHSFPLRFPLFAILILAFFSPYDVSLPFITFLTSFLFPSPVFTERKRKMVGFGSDVPHWLEILLGEKFFNACVVHECAKKNEKNIFCLDCCTSICPHCLLPHRHHRLLQIRRYVYHDVIRLDDAQKLMDCSLVQSYTTNSAKVVFLNQRPMSRPFRGSGNLCYTCDRSLQDPYVFCSLACKVYHTVNVKGGAGKHVSNFEFLPLPDKARGEVFSELDDRQMTPESVLDSGLSLRTSSGSGSTGGAVSCRALVCTATTEFVKKKRSSVSVPRFPFRPILSPGTDVAGGINRRKGVPHRSPLH